MESQQLTKIKAAIEAIREATGTEAAMTSNQEIRDGSRIFLESVEGWFICITGGPLHFGQGRPSLGLSLRGYLHNPMTNLLEAMTLHHLRAMDTSVDLQIDDDVDYLTPVLGKLVPSIRAGAKQLLAQWATEKSRNEAIENIQKDFEMPGTTKKFTVSGSKVQMSVGPDYSRANKAAVAMSLTLSGLSPDQTRAILKILSEQPALAR